MNKANRKKLRTDVYVERVGVFHGYVTDISIYGATLCLEQNLNFIGKIKLRIYFYPLSVAEQPRVIDLDGDVKYTIYSSKNFDFRSEVQFTKFSSESDREFFKKRVAV